MLVRLHSLPFLLLLPSRRSEPVAFVFVGFFFARTIQFDLEVATSHVRVSLISIMSQCVRAVASLGAEKLTQCGAEQRIAVRVVCVFKDVLRLYGDGDERCWYKRNQRNRLRIEYRKEGWREEDGEAR